MPYCGEAPQHASSPFHLRDGRLAFRADGLRPLRGKFWPTPLSRSGGEQRPSISKPDGPGRPESPPTAARARARQPSQKRRSVRFPARPEWPSLILKLTLHMLEKCVSIWRGRRDGAKSSKSAKAQSAQSAIHGYLPRSQAQLKGRVGRSCTQSVWFGRWKMEEKETTTKNLQSIF